VQANPVAIQEQSSIGCVETSYIKDPEKRLPTSAVPMAKNQTTLLSFKQPPAEAIFSEKDSTLKNVVSVIESLSLKVHQIGKQNATLQQLVFEDDHVRAAVLAMREAKNIYSLIDEHEFLEFFYDEDSETAILRCLPCFKLHQLAKRNIRHLSPFEAQQKICPSLNGTLCSGSFFNKSTTHLLIEGGNQTWYRQKILHRPSLSNW
jgi:hypothetical protein